MPCGQICIHQCWGWRLWHLAWLLLAAVYVGRFSFSSSDEFLSSAAKQLEEVASLLLMNYSFVYFTGKVANKLSISFSRLSNSSSNLMDGLIHAHIACSMSILGLLIAGLVPTKNTALCFLWTDSEGLLTGQSILYAFSPKDIFEQGEIQHVSARDPRRDD